MTASAQRARSRIARLLPYAAAVLALPLLGPTCGSQQPGQKAFAKGSIVIPMDACYQNTGGTAPDASCPSNGGSTRDAGDVIKAYGLVYQLVRAGVPVYWVIQSGKTALTGADLTLLLQGGAPVTKYDWAGGTAGTSMPPNNAGSSITYMGGPWVIDGSDFAAANAVLQQAGIKSVFAAAPAVNLHVSQVAFTGYAAKVFAGGWNAGGAVAPKLALLNIPGGDGRYADHVLEGYLIRAGLAPQCVLSNPPCADSSAGTASPAGHGQIYDRLEAADFLPPTCTTDADCPSGSLCTTVVGAQRYCDWRSTNLYTYGYKVLWLPHWTGHNSCEGSLGAGYSCGTGGGCSLVGGDACSCVTCGASPGTLSDSQLDAVLATIGGYLSAGNDVFGECGGIGTLEGVYSSTSPFAVNATYGDGNPASRFQTSAATFPSGGGLHVTTSVTAPACSADAGGMSCVGGELYQPGYFSSPFLQLGDYPFVPQSGVITEYWPAAGNGATGYAAGVDSLIARMSGQNRLDYFTIRPATSSAGNAVYLGGHDYSGFQGTFQIGGTRLVMNTLFNLSAACQPRNTPCQQLKNLGVCRPGTWQCCEQADIDKGYCDVAGEPVCRPTLDPPGAAETCNGLDDDCDGIVDNHLTDPEAQPATSACYGGPPATVNPATGQPYGICQKGVYSCQPAAPNGPWVCVGDVLPRAETCNGLDDDCNGTVDDAGELTPPGGSASCFTGPPDAVLQSQNPESQCKAGAWTCLNATWACLGQQLPQQEICEGALHDYNCNGVVGDGCQCAVGTTRTCYAGPAGTAGLGACRSGVQTCVQDPALDPGQGTWDNPSCSGQVLPQAEVCDNGIDDDCNGSVDDCSECQSGQTRPCYPAGASGCSGGPGGPFACQGVCAAGSEACDAGTWSGQCSGAITPGPELCDGKDNTCSGTIDETNAPCATGLACLNGVCTQPTWGGESDCLPGYCHTADCQPGTGTSGACVARNCPAAPCPGGQLCQGGTTCVDPCQGTTCAPGAFCSIGLDGKPACIGGGCSATGCTGGDVCRNGTCQADACAGAACPAGTFCRGNYALATPTYDCVRVCATVTCPTGQACGPDGFCAPDPCATTTCAAGQVCKANGTTASCVADPCPAGICGAKQVCVDGPTGPRCADDPCAGITCPAGVCSNGQCYASNNIHGYGPPPATSAAPSKGGGCGCGGGDAGPTALLLSLLALPLAGRRRGGSSGARRAARPGRGLRGALGGGALALAALLALGPGCSKKKAAAPLNCETCGTDHCVDVQFDAGHCSTCAHACAGGEVCVDATCIAGSPAVPSISSVSPAPVAAHTSPTFTIAGQGFLSGATLRLSGAGLQPTEVSCGAAGACQFVSSSQLGATVDLGSAVPGELSVQVANPDHTTSNSVSVDVVTPTPVIDSLSPASAPAGTRPSVHVAGSAFTQNAVCVQRDPRSAGPDLVIPPDSTPGAAAMDCTLDLGAVVPGTIQIIVQNENLVQSAPRSFDVTTTDPSISSLSPSAAAQGAEIRLVVSGGGFVPGSKAQIDRGAGYLDLSTSFVAPSLLQAQLSLADYAAGDYPVRVTNPPSAGSPAPPPSAPATFTVTPNAPVATGLAVTPASPRVGDAGVLLALSGSGFTAACQVEVQRPSGATWLGPPDATTGSGTTPSSIQGTTDMVAGSEGTWYARASCPTGCPGPPCLTSAFPFQVATNVASLASVTPAGGSQGTSVSVTVAGANFAPGMTLRVSGAAADVAAALDATTPATRATASIPLAGLDVGCHLLQAVNLGASASNGVAFSVTPGAPSLASISTTCTPSTSCTAGCAVQVASPVTITLAGANFGTGVSTVMATPQGMAPQDLSTVPGATVTVVDSGTIQVVLDPTQVLATSYQIEVENPGQPPSGSLPYKVSATTCP
jgi:hypothetical protein